VCDLYRQVYGSESAKQLAVGGSMMIADGEGGQFDISGFGYNMVH